jgi:predicted nucleic acid-binding protein
VTLFVDTSVWYAAIDAVDVGNRPAKSILASGRDLVTSNLVVLETWLLLRNRLHWHTAEEFLAAILSGIATMEAVDPTDFEAAYRIGMKYRDQHFSLTDRTSFALMERLGIRAVASFDQDFAVYRFGRRGSEAFEVLR